jgi:lipopolysaccharide biosynthesis glycosyltransferase
MKKAMCIMLDDNFLVGYKVFMKSFLNFNKWFDSDLLVIDVGLTDAGKKEIEKLYKKVVYKTPLYENYKATDMSGTHDRLKNTYYTLDVFSYSDYDRIVFMDVDMLVLADVSLLFETDYDFAGCKAYRRKIDDLMTYINTGVFVIGKKYLNKNIYKKLLSIAEKGLMYPDQDAINICFKKVMEYLPKEYNIEKRMFNSKRFSNIAKPENIKILHFVGNKPWQDKILAPQREWDFVEYEKLWHEWNKK